MEPGPSKDHRPENSSGALGFLFGFGRFVGFLLLAAPALVIVAALVLLPPYQRMAAKAYELEKLKVDNTAFKDYVSANDRLIRDAAEDEVLTMRLRISQERLLPKHEVVVVDPAAPPAPPPGVIVPVKYDYPPPPTNMLLSMADKLRDPNSRRGLFLLSAMAMMAAMFLFASPEKYTQAPPEQANS